MSDHPHLNVGIGLNSSTGVQRSTLLSMAQQYGLLCIAHTFVHQKAHFVCS